MIRAAFNYDEALVERMARFADLLPNVTQDAVNRRVVPPVRKLVKTLGDDPGPVKRPIEWRSERQRRAFFATDGFGHGIPYHRTGRYRRGWKVTVNSSNGALVVVARNEVDYAPFVGGLWQQPFHRNTGWQRTSDVLPKAEQVINRTLPFVLDDVADAWEGL